MSTLGKMWIFLLPILLGHFEVSAKSLGDLSGPWHLFVDDSIITTKTNTTRTYHQFQKESTNPVLTADLIWEEDNNELFGTVLPKENGLGYRMWYSSPHYSLYAESEDGLLWDKPSQGLFSYQGISDTNILAWRGMINPSIVHTPWDANPKKHYRGISFFSPGGGFAGISAEGIKWVTTAGNPVLPAQNKYVSLVWNAHEGQYFASLRLTEWKKGYLRRSVGVALSDDFIRWTAPTLVLTPDGIDDSWVTEPGQRTDFSHLSAFPYESGYLGFLSVFRITDGDNDGPIHVELVSSRDGILWTRTDPVGTARTPVLPLGANGKWDDGMIFTSTHPLVEGNLIKLWYGGYNHTHDEMNDDNEGSIGLATMRKDGFASLDADRDRAVIVTKKIQNISGPLLINANAKNGWIRAEVLDNNGKVIRGYGYRQCRVIRSDGTQIQVRWRWYDNLPSTSEPISLRFTMYRASLYSFMAGDKAHFVEESL